MLSSTLKDRVIIQVKTITQGALGQTIIWTPVETQYARVIPLDAKARAVYQQLQSEVTHKIVMRDTVSLNLGLNRLKWKEKTLELVEPTQEVGDTTVVMVKEV